MFQFTSVLNDEMRPFDLVIALLWSIFLDDASTEILYSIMRRRIVGTQLFHPLLNAEVTKTTKGQN
jgi:hypothetical protein